MQREHVVFALGAQCREQLFTRFDPARFPAMDCEWIDVSAFRARTWEEFLFAARPTVLVTGWGTPTIPESYAQSPDLSLRYVCHLVGSVKQIVPRRLLERGVLVSNWGTGVGSAVAEHALLLVLGTLRNLPAWEPFMQNWSRQKVASASTVLATRTLRGQRVGLHGFGSVARELVHLLRPFSVELSAYSLGVPPGLFEQHGVRRRGDLKELFSNSDILIECEALTRHNEGSVNEDVLRCLPDGAVFVNVGRGHLVDEAALIRVSRENSLRLGLDVYQEEPLPASSVFHGMEGCLLSPHIAGPTGDAFSRLCEFSLANLLRHLRREKIEAVVSLDVYDRST